MSKLLACLQSAWPQTCEQCYYNWKNWWPEVFGSQVQSVYANSVFVFRTVSPELKSYALGVLFLLLRLIGKNCSVYWLHMLYCHALRTTENDLFFNLTCYTLCNNTLTCSVVTSLELNFICLRLFGYEGNSNWICFFNLWPAVCRNPLPFQALSRPHWSSAWASTPPVCSGAQSAARREPACCTTMWPTGICTSASPSCSSRRPSSCTPPRGSVWERTTGNTSRTARVTSRPPNSSPPMWLWTIWARRSPRTQPTGQSSYTTWRTQRCVTTWSLFYSGGLHRELQTGAEAVSVPTGLTCDVTSVAVPV